jgi:hypothetical protein
VLLAKKEKVLQDMIDKLVGIFAISVKVKESHYRPGQALSVQKV